MVRHLLLHPPIILRTLVAQYVGVHYFEVFILNYMQAKVVMSILQQRNKGGIYRVRCWFH